MAKVPLNIVKQQSIPQGPSSPGYKQGTANTVKLTGPMGPSSPGYLQGTANTVKAPSAVGQVLGMNNFSGGAGIGVPSVGNSNNNGPRLEQVPDAPSFDETPFNELMGQIDALGGVFRDQTETATQGIQQRGDVALTELEGNRTEAEQGLQQYKTQAEQDANQNVNAERRQYAEIQQGLQARYGGTTDTGRFVSELAGRQTTQNIGQFKQSLQNEFSKVNQMQVNLLRTYETEKTKLKTSTEQLIAEARGSLQQQMAQLQIQKGQVNADKVARKEALLSNYQNTVNDINARNTQYLRQLDEQKQAIQNQLQSQTYKMTYAALQKSLNFYESFVNAGTLSPTGLREAEGKFGLGQGSLQPPQRNRAASSQGVISEEDLDSYLNESN